MKLTLTAERVQQIKCKALDDYLAAEGFDLNKSRVMLEMQDPSGRVTHYYFEQDDTPDIPGDNPNAEWLEALSNTDGG
jgi:hypothetical protein